MGKVLEFKRQGDIEAGSSLVARAKVVRPLRHLTEAGDVARMASAEALGRVMRDRKVSGRQLAGWLRVDERRVREMLSGENPIACERFVSDLVPVGFCEALFEAMKETRRAA